MKTKKIALLSFLACACLVGGAVGMNANSVSAEAPVVTMRAGASLRVPVKDAAADADKDGIKFRATFDLETVMALEGEKSVGMFIAPADYYEQAPINETNCFSDDAVYCWGGAAAGKTEIVHVDGYAYKHSEEATVLTMDASLWNLKATSLEKEFVGVAYLQAGDTYYFAEPAYATPVAVAQKALLNANDTIYNIEGDEEAPARVEAAYVAPLLGEGKVYNYTENVYKQQKNGEYTLEATAEKEVTVTSWDQVAEVETPANYVNYTAKSSSMVMNLVGDNTKNVYFNYAGNRVVLWDGDENLADDDTFQVANKSYIAEHPDFGYFFEASDKAIYEGKSGVVHGNKIQSWGGPYWENKVLPAATNTFSVILHAEYDMPNFKGEFKGVTDTGASTGWLEFNSSEIVSYEVLDTFGKESCAITDSTNAKGAPVLAVEAGLYKLTFTLPVNVASLSYFEFNTADLKPFYIDNFCAENIKTVGTTEVPHVFSGTLTFPAPAVIDTTIWDGETSDLAPEVTYQSNLATEPSDLVAEDGVYTLTPEEGAYKYEIVINGKSYTTVNGVSLVDFSVPLAERDYFGAISSSQYGLADDNANVEGVKVGITIVEMDGKGALTTASNGWWMYAHKKASAASKNFEQVAGFVPTKVGAWIYSTTARNLEAWVYGITAGSSATNPSSVAVPVGYSYVEFGCAKSLADAYAFGFGFGSPKSLYVFEIVLIP